VLVEDVESLNILVEALRTDQARTLFALADLARRAHAERWQGRGQGDAFYRLAGRRHSPIRRITYPGRARCPW